MLRYLISSIMALWGFYLIFKNGINREGEILLSIALIGTVTTFIFDIGNKYLKNR